MQKPKHTPFDENIISPLHFNEIQCKRIIRMRIYGKERRKEGSAAADLFIISKLGDRLESRPRAAAWEIIGDS